MYLAALSGRHVRALEPFELELDPHLNLFVGDNAAGKTTLLESAFLLSCGRSFRSARPSELLPPGVPSLHLRGRLQRGAAPPTELGLEASHEGVRVSDATGRPWTVTELAQAAPMQVLEPGSHRVVEDGPSWRRRYLDWGLFHVEPRFLPAWRRYQRALQQRNAALRSTSPGLARAFDGDLVAAAADLTAFRSGLAEALRHDLDLVARQLLGATCRAELYPGWAGEQDFAQALAAAWPRDRQAGLTHAGPHRADLRLKLEGQAIRHRASRGQQKLLLAALLFAQARLVGAAKGAEPILLFDDLASELDGRFRQRLLEALTAYRGQCLITATEAPSLAGARLFHVEHGRVTGA